MYIVVVRGHISGCHDERSDLGNFFQIFSLFLGEIEVNRHAIVVAMSSIKISWIFGIFNCFILLTVSGDSRPGVRTLLTTRGLNLGE